MKWNRLFGRGESRKKGPEPIVFEEVPGEDEPEPIMADASIADRAARVLQLQNQLLEAKRSRTLGTAETWSVELAEARLAKALYEQAAENDERGTGKPGEMERTLREWRAAENKLHRAEMSATDRARLAAERIAAEADGIAIGPDTEEQIRRHPPRRVA